MYKSLILYQKRSPLLFLNCICMDYSEPVIRLEQKYDRRKKNWLKPMSGDESTHSVFTSAKSVLEMLVSVKKWPIGHHN